MVLFGACGGALDRPGYSGKIPTTAHTWAYRGLCGPPDVPLLIEIDTVRGERPSRYAIRHLETVVGRVCRKRAPVTVRVDEVIEREGRALARREIAETARQHMTLLKEARTQGWRYAYVLYVPYIAEALRGKGSRGYSQWMMTTDGQRVPFACIAKAKIGEYAFLWLTERKLERTVLLHEFGHLLGLRGVYRNHCHRPTCIMYYDLDARLLMANALAATLWADLPHDFGAYCRAQLERARRGEGR